MLIDTSLTGQTKGAKLVAFREIKCQMQRMPEEGDTKKVPVTIITGFLGAGKVSY